MELKTILEITGRNIDDMRNYAGSRVIEHFKAQYDYYQRNIVEARSCIYSNQTSWKQRKRCTRSRRYLNQKTVVSDKNKF